MAMKPIREKGKRWGKVRGDIRDWLGYNEELVVRGEFFLELGWVKSWSKEVAVMNLGKRGAPYTFPESLIEWQALWNQMVGVRGVEGVTRELVEKGLLLMYNDYSTIHRRVKKITPCFDLPKHGFCCVATDGTGIKMHHAGEYRQIKYGGSKRKFVRVIISANPFTKDLLDVEVSVDGEGKSEPQVAIQHMTNLTSFGIEIDKFWGDGAFDSKELFNFLDHNSIDSAIPPRDNSADKADGSMRRAREVAEYKSKTWDEWARDKQYGKRWLGTEGIISSVKGIFGEDTRAKTAENACLEAGRKFWHYEKMRKYAQAKIKTATC